MINQLINLCVKLQLQPRNFRSKKIQKTRRLRQFKINFSLKFGSIGLMLTRPLQFTGGTLSKLKIFVKRSSRKSDKTRRAMWFNAFPHLPLTKKPTGLRMGKGKGKLVCWFTNIRGGIILMEFRNLRRGRAFYYINQMIFKLGMKMPIISNFSQSLSLPLLKSKKIICKSFW